MGRTVWTLAATAAALAGAVVALQSLQRRAQRSAETSTSDGPTSTESDSTTPPRDLTFQRDKAFLGLHPPGGAGLAERDLYGTLREKWWSADLEWLLDQLEAAHASLLAASPRTELPRKPGLNPVPWTVGHVAFTFDALIAATLHLARPGELLTRNRRIRREDAWELYDSMRISADARWGMAQNSELPDAHQYLADVHAQAKSLACEVARGGKVPPVESYLILYAIMHELWHTEDVIHTCHSHRLPPPVLPSSRAPMLYHPTLDPSQAASRAAGLGDAHIPGGLFHLGARAPEGWLAQAWRRARAGQAELPQVERAPPPRMVFDCEKWEHPVQLAPFEISRTCVTNAEFRRFIEAGGYGDEQYWSHEGKQWLRESGAKWPWTWRRADAGWFLLWFDTELPLPEHQPVSHVSWYEAEAYCRWAGRRLPTEAEWEAACCATRTPTGGLAAHKGRTFPWGEAAPSSATANAAMRSPHLLEVDALPDSDSPWGVRQMIGNVWEWTATTFYPYPGYVMDFPYREQSAPWFGFQKVARGGCFATPDLILRGDYRSFYHPSQRREVAVGFRTCAL